LLNKETPSRLVILLGAIDHRNVFDLRPWLLCETGGETNGSESLGLSMQQPKRTVSLLKAQTIRPAVDWAYCVSFVLLHAVPQGCGRTREWYPASNLRTMRWFPELSAGRTLYSSARQYWVLPEAPATRIFYRLFRMPVLARSSQDGEL
jgi:hypothetical protein